MTVWVTAASTGSALQVGFAAPDIESIEPTTSVIGLRLSTPITDGEPTYGMALELLEPVRAGDVIADVSASEMVFTRPISAPLLAAELLEIVAAPAASDAEASGAEASDLAASNLVALEGTLVEGEQVALSTATDRRVTFTTRELIIHEDGHYSLSFEGRTTPVNVSPGHADVGVADGGHLEVSCRPGLDGDTTSRELVFAGESKGRVLIDFDLLLELDDSGGDAAEIAVPIRRKRGRLFRVTIAPGADADDFALMTVDPSTERLVLAPGVAPTAATFNGGWLSLLAGDFFKGLDDIALKFSEMELVSRSGLAVITEGIADGFALEGIDLDVPFDLGGSALPPLGTAGGRLRFNRALVCASETPRDAHSTGGAVELSLTLNDDSWLLADTTKPFTLQLHGGTSFKVSLDPTYPAVGVFGGDGPAGTIYVPGTTRENAADGRRFVLDVAGQGLETDSQAVQDLPRRFMIGPGGVDLTAAVRPFSVSLAGKGKTNAIDEAKTLEGAFSVEGGDYLVYVKASSKLPYFQNASGTMEVTAASRGWVQRHGDEAAESGALHIRFTVNFERTWKDPSGVMELENPSVRVDIRFDGDWTVDAAMSGSLIITPPKKMGSGAKVWAGNLFDHVKLDFNEVALSDFKENQDGLKDKVSLQLVLARPVRISMWELLTLEIRSLSLRWMGVEVGGRIGMSIKAVSLEATLPNLVLSLEDGIPKLGVAGVDDGNFSIYGKLVVQGQVSAEVEVTRERSHDREALSGKGSLAIQGLPTVRLAFRFGRLRVDGEWVPLIFLFGSVDYPIQLYKGVVLREYGAGFGVNQTLSGLEAGGALDTMSLQEWVRSPEAFPEPTNPGDWVDDPGAFMLVARTFVAPTKLASDVSQAYLLDAILTLDERFNVVLMVNGWLFTSIDDGKTKEFRENPVARGAIVIYSKNLTMEGYMESELSPTMGTPLHGLAPALSTVRTQYSFFASPDRLFLELGPIRRSYEVLSMSISGSERYAVEIANGDLWVLARWELGANFAFAKRLEYKFGPASVTAGVSLTARFALEGLVGGGYVGRALMVYTRVAVHMSARLTLRVKATVKVDMGFYSAKVTLVDQSFNMQLTFDAVLDGVVTTNDLGLQGSGEVRVRVLRWTLKFRVDVTAGNTRQLANARTRFAAKLNRLLA